MVQLPEATRFCLGGEGVVGFVGYFNTHMRSHEQTLTGQTGL